MNKNFTKQILELGDTQQVVNAMMARRTQILEAIADGTAQPTDELMRELFELNVGLGDAGIEVTQ